MTATLPTGCEPHASAPRRFTTSHGVQPPGMEGQALAILNAVSVALYTSAAPKTWLTAAKGTTLNGTSGADVLSAPNGQATLIGGGGDDTYVIWDASNRIVELANGGIDTVQSYASAYPLADFGENLQLMRTGIS